MQCRTYRVAALGDGDDQGTDSVYAFKIRSAILGWIYHLVNIVRIAIKQQQRH